MIFFKEKVKTKEHHGKEIYEEIFKRKSSIEQRDEKLIKVLVSSSEFISLGVFLNHKLSTSLWLKKNNQSFIVRGLEIVKFEEIKEGSDHEEFYVQDEKSCDIDGILMGYCDTKIYKETMPENLIRITKI